MSNHFFPSKTVPFFILLLSLLLCSSLLRAQGFQELERIVAVVEDDVILRSQLEQRLLYIQSELTRSNRPLPPRAEFEKEVLEQMILEKIEMQIAQQNGIRVDDSTLGDTMERIAQQNGKTLTEFKTMIEADGLIYRDLRERIRTEMILTRLRQRMIANRINITEQDVRNFLMSPDGQAQLSASFHIGHILINQNDAQAEQEAKTLVKKLTEGADFFELAKTYSGNPDLGWRKAEQLPTLFAQPAQKLQIGEVHSPIKSPSGFHIIKLIDKQGGDHKIVSQTLARHILITPNEVRSETDSLHLISDIREQIVKGSSFAEMARTYSEDPISANDGGKLGWANPGEYVPQFEETMAKTTIGEISKPFQSGFGWHILEVLDRREYNVGREFQLNQARGILQQQQFENELQLWLREIRQNAFVDMKV